MKVINETRNLVLADDAQLANTPILRIRGLLGKKELPKNQALIIKPCNSIHTFFMRFAIDCLFLDKDNCVVRFIPAIKPFRVSPIIFRAKTIVEFSAGAINPASISVGDLITF
ncbi:MAG: DUF192 domain-containing protein [Candidatus Omnitrophica bacterium]|nr:DUF192 domain-containing protein [Candidatus Omnitrophota bacterium]